MNRLNYNFILLSVMIVLSSCSSVKVLDSWKSDRIPEVKNNNFLVVARANNQQARIAFENEIVRQMESNGYKATASFAKFENMKLKNPESEVSKEDLKKIWGKKAKTTGMEANVKHCKVHAG
ncbi:MAG: hypothetical protein HRT68_09605, partial [Flavobacteriaceae bacterium]|nr:hypothetical protein [Flavobacteriaceae bacterium]